MVSCLVLVQGDGGFIESVWKCSFLYSTWRHKLGEPDLGTSEVQGNVSGRGCSLSQWPLNGLLANEYCVSLKLTLGFPKWHSSKSICSAEMQVWSLDWEDHFEWEMATHSSILPGEYCWQRSLVGYSLWGPKESDTTWHSIHTCAGIWSWTLVCWEFLNKHS